MGFMNFGNLKRRLLDRLIPRHQPAISLTAESVRHFKEGAWQTSAAAARYFDAVSQVSLGMQTELAAALRFAQGRVLDVGAGTGRFAKALVGDGHPVTAVDLSIEMLRRAAAGELAPDCVQASAFALPFADNQFDSVVSFWLLLHFVDWERILSEMLRVAKPGAPVTFEVQNAANLKQASLLTGDRRFEPKAVNEFQIFTTTEEIASSASQMGAVIDWSRHYDLFTDNLVARATLGPRYESWLAEVEDTFKDDACRRYWLCFEEEALPQLPAYLARKTLIVIRKGLPQAEEVCFNDQPLFPSGQRVSNNAIIHSRNLFLEAFTPACRELPQLFEQDE